MQDWATALVIVPCCLTQQWFPQFIQLVKPGAAPLLMPAHQYLLQLPGTKLQLPVRDRLSLLTIIFSGTSQQQDCHLTSPRPLEDHRGSAHSKNIAHKCEDCWTSATNGSLIFANQL